MKRERIISVPLQRTLARMLESIGVRGYVASLSKSDQHELGLRCDITDQDGEIFSASGTDFAEVIDTAVLAADAARLNKQHIPEWIKE